ncbi:hypothetical protein KPL70_003873 [Citrus sinensis]|uniref:uncharacterized protein LOC112100982 n=1 Tax=Citrus clementina TaxID=85681 RepID=UPI0007635DFA|nr:uncharacterized protein LOC112100982 [Citrus x clementina]KAH9744904.1 hypothetical protein KPL70_003873 [Citrus sinensis]
MFLPFFSFAKPQKRTFAFFSFNPIILWSLPLLLPSRPSSLLLLLPSKPNGPSAEPNSKPSDQSTIRHRGPSTDASTSASSSSSLVYTEEPIAIVKQIKKTKDYYFLPSSDLIYALSRFYPYEYKFTTERGVDFYVKSGKFEQDYPMGSAQRVSLEKQVEKDYFTILAQNCRLEIQRQQWGFIKETPHCDMWQKFQYSPAW